MPEKTKRIKRGQTSRKKTRARKKSIEEEAVEPEIWNEDRQKKSYYYDDAYGYEIYNPETDEDDDAAENS